MLSAYPPWAILPLLVKTIFRNRNKPEKKSREPIYFYSQFLNNNYLIVLRVIGSIHFFVFSTKQINKPPQNNTKNKIYEIEITTLVFLKSLFIVYLVYNSIPFIRNFLYSYVTVSIIFLIQLAAKFLLLLFIEYMKNRKKFQQGKALAMQDWSLESHP